MEFIDTIKARLPEYAKDISLNLEGTIARSSLPAEDAIGIALAAAFAARNHFLVETIGAASELGAPARRGALSAAALMGMNNVWYPYVEMAGNAQLRTMPAQLRMNAYADHGGTTKRQFESFALAASIVGKCHFCVSSHFEVLQREGLEMPQLRDIGRIAAVVNAAALTLAAQGVH